MKVVTRTRILVLSALAALLASHAWAAGPSRYSNYQSQSYPRAARSAARTPEYVASASRLLNPTQQQAAPEAVAAPQPTEAPYEQPNVDWDTAIGDESCCDEGCLDGTCRRGLWYF